MTVTMTGTQMTTLEYAETVARAVAEVLPSVQPLTPAEPQAGTEHVTTPFAGAAIAEISGRVQGSVVLLVAADLVEALAQSPIDGLDLAAATQPAFDAAAGVLGATAGPARTTELSLVLSDLNAPFTVVPLVGSGIAAAVLVPDATLGAALATAPAPEQSVEAVVGAMPETISPAPPGVPVAAQAPVSTRGIEMLHGVVMDVTVEIGRARMTVRDLLALNPGTVLELDRAAGSPADLLVNGRLIARGEVVVVDEDFGLRVTEIVDDSAAS